MDNQVLGIDKGIVKAFGLMVLLVGSLTTFFLSEYISAVVLGAVYYPAVNGTTYTYTAVTGESFIADNTTPRQLANYPIVVTSLVLSNASGTGYGNANFTITYNNATLLLKGISEINNGTAMLANYTYETTTTSTIPISSDAVTLVGTSEDDFITTFGYLNTGIKFASALITVVAVILVFSSFLPKRGKKEDMGY